MAPTSDTLQNSSSPQRSTVRRVDVRLRARFPHITTRIFELNQYQHVIYVPRDLLDVKDFSKTFEEEFRPVTAQLTLTNNPSPGGSEIPGIGDDEIAKRLEGFHVTRPDMEVYIAAFFPAAPEVTFCNNSGARTFEIGFASSVSSEMAAEIRSFAAFHLPGLDVQISTRPSEPRRQISDRVVSMTALDFRPFPQRKGLPSFIKQEEESFFSNLDQITGGYITPRSFPILNDAGMACYIHSTTFPQLDLRQILLAFDTIYIEPPLIVKEGDESAFWSSQSIDRDDLLKMIAADRVRLIHSQPEERSDLGFLREAHEANAAGVIGRRTTAALMLSDIVETAREYSLSRPEMRNEVVEVILRLADELKAPVDEIARSLFYPDRMRRLAVESLTNQGVMGSSSFSQGDIFAEVMKRVQGKDVSIEAANFGQSMHTAHMLNATFIPPLDRGDFVNSWILPMQMMGDRLNFYRAMNSRTAAAWATNERGLESRKIILPPIPLLEFEHHASIDDVLSLTSRASGRRKGRSIIGRLAALPEEERALEVDRIKREMYEKAAGRIQRKGVFSLLDMGITLSDYAAGWGIPPFSSGWKLINKALDVARAAPAIDRFIDVIEEDLARPGNEDIDFLSKISRVAKLRK